MSPIHSASGPALDSRRVRFTTHLPSTRLGRVSMWLAMAFLVGFAMNTAMVPIVGMSTNPAVNDFSRTYLPYWGVTLFAFGFAAGAVGLVAILKDKERSIVTLLALVPMLFVTMFLLGEFLIPH
jgi:hydrogenase/urease accessory protein HupE